MNLSVHRSLAVSLALAAMLLRALLPDGWMPNTGSAAGASPFIICSIDGAHKSVPGQPVRDNSHAPCAFAAAAPLAPPALANIAFAAPSLAVFIEYAGAIASPAVFALHRPNAARAPPAFA